MDTCAHAVRAALTILSYDLHLPCTWLSKRICYSLSVCNRSQTTGPIHSQFRNSGAAVTITSVSNIPNTHINKSSHIVFSLTQLSVHVLWKVDQLPFVVFTVAARCRVIGLSGGCRSAVGGYAGCALGGFGGKCCLRERVSIR